MADGVVFALGRWVPELEGLRLVGRRHRCRVHPVEQLMLTIEDEQGVIHARGFAAHAGFGPMGCALRLVFFVGGFGAANEFLDKAVESIMREFDRELEGLLP